MRAILLAIVSTAYTLFFITTALPHHRLMLSKYHLYGRWGDLAVEAMILIARFIIVVFLWRTVVRLW